MITNKVCVIMGHNDSIFTLIAKEMAKNGYVVAMLDNDKGMSKRVSDEICTFGGIAKAYLCNYNQIKTITNAHNSILSELGKCNVIVNCIGNHYSENDCDALLSANDVFVNDMSGEIGCSIINVCPKDIIGNGIENIVINSTRKTALTLGKYNIKINTIIYAFMSNNTPDIENANDNSVSEFLSRIPMGRLGRIDEIFGAVKYFTDMTSSYTTGNVIYVDGGYTVQSLMK